MKAKKIEKKLEWFELPTLAGRMKALQAIIEPQVEAKRAPEFIARHHDIVRHESKRRKKLQSREISGTQDDNE
jgi:hypothetical protein